MDILLKLKENDIEWENNAYVKIVQPSRNLMEIQANKEGLLSLAKQFLTLAYSTDEDFYIHHWAEKNTPNGYIYGDLEDGSLELSVSKVSKKGR